MTLFGTKRLSEILEDMFLPSVMEGPLFPSLSISLSLSIDRSIDLSYLLFSYFFLSFLLSSSLSFVKNIKQLVLICVSKILVNGTKIRVAKSINNSNAIITDLNRLKYKRS